MSDSDTPGPPKTLLIEPSSPTLSLPIVLHPPVVAAPVRGIVLRRCCMSDPAASQASFSSADTVPHRHHAQQVFDQMPLRIFFDILVVYHETSTMAGYSVREDELLYDVWLATSAEFVGMKQKGTMFGQNIHWFHEHKHCVPYNLM